MDTINNNSINPQAPQLENKSKVQVSNGNSDIQLRVNSNPESVASNDTIKHHRELSGRFKKAAIATGVAAGALAAAAITVVIVATSCLSAIISLSVAAVILVMIFIKCRAKASFTERLTKSLEGINKSQEKFLNPLKEECKSCGKNNAQKIYKLVNKTMENIKSPLTFPRKTVFTNYSRYRSGYNIYGRRVTIEEDLAAGIASDIVETIVDQYLTSLKASLNEQTSQQIKEEGEVIKKHAIFLEIFAIICGYAIKEVPHDTLAKLSEQFALLSYDQDISPTSQDISQTSAQSIKAKRNIIYTTIYNILKNRLKAMNTSLQLNDVENAFFGFFDKLRTDLKAKIKEFSGEEELE